MTARATPPLRGDLREQEPMSRHVSWRAGGCARRYFEPADVRDLTSFLAALPALEPLLWVGLGSNLLVRDGGFNGTVIATFRGLNELEMHAPGEFRVEAGVSCAKLARQAAREGYTGAEFFAGIPGSMGGALAMNAGAFGGETWDWVQSVETLDRNGQWHLREASDYQVGYRSVQGPSDEYFVAATLRFERGDVAAAQSRIKELLATRSATQPTKQPSCGSVFRNPPGDHAARLIEASGLKGYCIGGACVSTKHANFIVNTGNASADEIERVLEHVRNEVELQQGVRLHTEVRIVGERKVAQQGEQE